MKITPRRLEIQLKKLEAVTSVIGNLETRNKLYKKYRYRIVKILCNLLETYDLLDSLLKIVKEDFREVVEKAQNQ